MNEILLADALNILKEEFYERLWRTHSKKYLGDEYQLHGWPGDSDEDIIVVNYQYTVREHIFHRHDYFYFNYSYKGTHKYYTEQNEIILNEKDLYAGQPFVSHAHADQENDDGVLVCIYMRPELVYRTLMPYITASPYITDFLIRPYSDKFSQQTIHFNLADDYEIRTLLELMIIEYANKTDETQDILKSFASAFIVLISRKYGTQTTHNSNVDTMSEIIKYINKHFNTVNLKELSEKFSYHPNYLSSLIKKETGMNFSQLLLEQRMKRATVMLTSTTLSVEQIGYMLGYSSHSNFHKAFKEYYGKAPRKYNIFQDK